MIRIVLLILLAVTMLAGYSEANSDFDTEVQSLFYKLTTQELAYFAEIGDTSSQQDILEPETNLYEETLKENFDETFDLILSKIRLEFSGFSHIPDSFWETAAEATIKAALSRSYGDDLLNYAGTNFKRWVNHTTSPDSSSVEHNFYYTTSAGTSVLYLQRLINKDDIDLPTKYHHAAKVWLDRLRSTLKKYDDEEVLTFVSNPFISHIIDEIKWVEEHNALPAYVPKLRWDTSFYNSNVDINPRIAVKSKKVINSSDIKPQNTINPKGFTITENSKLFTSDLKTYTQSVGMRVNVTGKVATTFDGTPFSLNDSIDLTIGRRTVSCEMASDINDSKLQRMQREASVITIEGSVVSISENMIFIKGCRIH